MTYAQALKILDGIPWNKLRYRVKQSNQALSEEQMNAVMFAITSLRHINAVEHTMSLEGQKVKIGG